MANTILRLLIIDDEQADADLIEELLGDDPAAAVSHCRTLQAALALLSDTQVDCVLCDLGLPDASDLEGLSALRQSHPGTPVIILTADSASERTRRALQSGAQDYLVKGTFDGPLLMRAISHARERHCWEEKVRSQADSIQAVNGISELIHAARDLDVIVEAVTTAARQLSGAETVAFVRGGGIDSICLDDVREHPLPDGLAPLNMPLVSYLAVPVIARTGEVQGALVLGHSQRAAFTAQTAERIAPLATQAAIAMENAKLIESLHRERIAAEERELRYRLLAEATPVIFWTTDNSGQATYLNQRWYEYTGRTVGSSPLEALHPSETLRVCDEFSTRLSQGEPFEMEYRLQRADGAYRWHLARALPLCDEQGALVKWLCVAVDIDEKKRTESELEAKVAERTVELESANRQLTEVDRLKSEFLALMSHELRTPLNSIIGFTELILYELVGPINEEQRRQLQYATKAGRHLLALITDILEVSRIEAGQVQVVREPIDLATVARDVYEMLQPQAVAKNLQVDLAGFDKLPLCRSDAGKVKQVLLSLLSNAIKFTPRGHVRISAEHAHGLLHLRVEDSGIGIAPESMERLFKPFTQVDSSDSRAYEGTGLGLYLCKKLVILLGGFIDADSKPGRGSVFTVRLPCDDVTLPTSRPA